MSKASCIRDSFLAAFALVIFCLSTTASASGVVSNATESSLVQAMAGGGSVTFAVNGTIYLTNTIVISNNTVLDATGYNVAISGSNAVQIFIINSNATVSMTNLSLINGYALGFSGYTSNGIGLELAGDGGAISNSGTLQLTGCAFISNSAVGSIIAFFPPTVGAGGAIYNAGIVTGQSCVFSGNLTVGGNSTNDNPGIFTSPAADGAGGAFFNANQATLTNCVFSNNTAVGGLAGTQGGAYSGENGETGGDGTGGAIFNTGSLVASNNAFAENVAHGGGGGRGSDAGDSGEFNYSEPGGDGGNGGVGCGGAICVQGGASIIVNNTFWRNSAVGGVGGAGGTGQPNDYPQSTPGNGGNGGGGGSASGGALGVLAGSVLAVNITVASNSLLAASGGAGGAGGAGRFGVNGPAGATGLRGAVEGDCIGNLGGTLTLKNSILSPSAAADTNIFGSIVDAGHNISSDQQDTLTNSTSLNGVDPDLAPLGNNGGPTPTMALLPGSPAIDGADPTDFPATDQRGVPRPFGPAPDIGAFEFTTTVTISGQIIGLLPTDQATVVAGPASTLTTNGGYSLQVSDTSFTISPASANYAFDPPSQRYSFGSNQTGVNFQAYRFNAIKIGPASPIAFNLIFAGTNGQQFRIEASTNLASWAPIVTNTIGSNGYLNVSFPMSNEGGRFYRLASP